MLPSHPAHCPLTRRALLSPHCSLTVLACLPVHSFKDPTAPQVPGQPVETFKMEEPYLDPVQKLTESGGVGGLRNSVGKFLEERVEVQKKRNELESTKEENRAKERKKELKLQAKKEKREERARKEAAAVQRAFLKKAGIEVGAVSSSSEDSESDGDGDGL